MLFAGSTQRYGSFSAPVGDAAVSMVDVRDIVEVAATVLTETGHDAMTYTLTGPEAITHRQIASEISGATTSTVTLSDAQPQEFAQQLEG